MEPTTFNSRLDALAFALQYHTNREGDPETIVETAHLFLNWLNEVEVS